MDIDFVKVKTGTDAIIVGTYEMQEAAKMNAENGGEGGGVDAASSFQSDFSQTLIRQHKSFSPLLTTIVTAHFIPVLGRNTKRDAIRA